MIDTTIQLLIPCFLHSTEDKWDFNPHKISFIPDFLRIKLFPHNLLKVKVLCSQPYLNSNLQFLYVNNGGIYNAESDNDESAKQEHSKMKRR